MYKHIKKLKKLKNLKNNLPLAAIALVVVLLILLFIASKIANDSENTAALKEISSPRDAAAYLSEFGWQVSESPSSVKEVRIPADFTPTYEDYNELQKSQGFDLSKYRSQTADMYTFKVLNHPSPGDVYANVLVCRGQVIAGDLVSYSINGFITKLGRNTADSVDS